jgi:plasmid stabilization system protein ParE
VADRPRFQADVAVQYFRRLQDTFAQFRGALHPNTGNRVKMIHSQIQIIDALFV